MPSGRPGNTWLSSRKRRLGGQFIQTPQFVPLAYPPGAQWFFGSAAAQTTVLADLGSTLVINAPITGWPSQFPYTLLLEWGTVNQEVATVTQAPTGSGPYTFRNVARGQDGTAQVTHAPGAQVNHGVSARDFFKSAPVYNVCEWGADPTGTTDSGPAIQQALLQASDYGGGGICHVPAGRYLTSITIGWPPGVWLRGEGPGVSTIRAVSGFSPPQNGNNSGCSVIQTYGNTGGQNFKISGITVDGNVTGNPQIPSYADAPESAPLSVWNASGLEIDDVQVINAIGYSIYLKYCTQFEIVNCSVTSGRTPTKTGQQDGIHVTDSQYGYIGTNAVDTGTSQATGDDAIAIQAYGTCTDIIITGNSVRGGNHGIVLVTSGGSISDVAIHGNDIWSAQLEGVILYPDLAGSGLISNVSVTGNTFGAVAAAGTSNALALEDYTAAGSTGAGWKTVVIAGNTFTGATITTSTKSAIFAGQGTGLAITGNVLNGLNTPFGIQVGVNPATSEPVNDFTVTGNMISMAASAQAFPVGISVQDSYDGAIFGNTVIGPGSGTGGSYGIRISAVATGATAATGIAVTGNRVSGFLAPISELNYGGTPDFNSIMGNVIHNCGGGVVTIGAHTTVSGIRFIQATAATTTGDVSTAVSITGLVASLDVGTYYLEITIPWEPAGTIGATTTFGLAAGSGLTLSAISMAGQISSGTSTVEPGTSALVVSTALSGSMWTSPTHAGTAGWGMATFWGTLTVSAAGTLQVVFANPTAADEATAGAGASMIVQPLA